MKEILDVVHKTIYQFFDVCSDNEEVPMSDKDKLLLEVNKAICNNIEALEQESEIDTTPVNKFNLGDNIVYGTDGNLYKITVSSGKEYEEASCEDAISRKIITAFLSGLISDDTERKKALQYVNELPPVNLQEKMEHWIPVSEELPKTEQYTFITVHNQTKMCWYQNGVFVDGEQNAYTKENEELVAWMPFQIPKPYKIENGAEE